MRSRVGFVILLALSAAGATCKSNATPPEADKKPPVATKKAVEEDEAPPVDDIPGVDITEVPPARRADFVRLLRETFCYCGCPRTLAACLTNREDCSCVRCSERMASFIQNHFAAGMSTEDVEMMLLDGFAEGYNGTVNEFALADHPSKGADEAPFTLVEFADFRCGHCKEAHPVLGRLVKENPMVRLVYFFYPLGNEDSPSFDAAEAAEEARLQGKFWPFADKLYEHGHSLDKAKILQLAGEVGLDVKKVKAALESHVHRPKVFADKAAGQKAQVRATPTIFVNGRRFGLPRTHEYLMTRLSMELERGRCE
jgi:protein-disulfide isomerase